MTSQLVFCMLLAGTSLAFAQKAQHSRATGSDQFSEAESLLQQGMLHSAKTSTLNTLKLHPSSVRGYNLLGIIEGNLQEYEDAIAAFQHALKIDPRSVKTHNNLANIYIAMRQADLAEKELRASLRLDPASTDANYNLGVLLMAQGNPAQAIPYLRKVKPPTIQSGFNLVRAYLQTGHTAEAITSASALSAQNKNNVQVHFTLGVLFATDKQYKAAVPELRQADLLAPGTFEILYNLGQALLRAGDNAEARLVLTRALNLKPDSAETLLMLAQVSVNDSRPMDALDLLIRAHKIAPKNTDVIFLMAQISMSQNYYEDAIPLLESGLEVDPRRADLLAALGESYFIAGKADKSIEVFNKLINLEHSARSYAFLGLSYRDLGRFDEAKKYFLEGLKLDPKNAACLFNLGFIAERQGDIVTAEKRFQETLKINPDFSDALLEMANLKSAAKNYAEAAGYLRRYVKVSRNPATGYYKLAMAERGLHQTAEADRDLKIFQTLSKNASSGPYPFQHLFDYLEGRAQLPRNMQTQFDITQLTEQIKKNPDQAENYYMLTEAYLKAGDFDKARQTVAALDKVSADDYRTLTGVGVLLARHRLFDDAIQHFKAAIQINPDSDDLKFDLANAYFKKRDYVNALKAAEQISEAGRQDESFLSLLGDIYAHSNDPGPAERIFQQAITRNPDSDQAYFALALLQFRTNRVEEARQTLLKAQARIPGSGKILWGLGLASVMDGNNADAAKQLERAVDIMPEWAGAYSALGVFYFETGHIDKARDVFSRFENSNARSVLDLKRIEQALDQAAKSPTAGEHPMSPAEKQQFLQMALVLADQTL